MNKMNGTEWSGGSRRPEVAVITGASAGVGRATVREFARHGYHIGLLARGRDRLEAARREVEEMDARRSLMSRKRVK
jgi:NADP-dependent 3-hydroxy acid dehydrogenase YdfG